MIKKQNPDRVNCGQVGPGIPFEERGRQSYDVVQAQNSRRQGTRQAEEDLWKSTAPSFYESVDATVRDTSHASYERTIAGQANGRVEPGATNPCPSWTEELDYLASFAGGSCGDQRAGSPYPWRARDGGRVPTTPLRQ